MTETMPVAVVLIGRNEGDRLRRALAAIPDTVSRKVYVDSGSTDQSIETARHAGAEVVALDLSKPFTAARGRNTGFAYLQENGDLPEFVQFIDGDCELDPDWLATALTFLRNDPDAAAVCGRRREKHPEASLYNWLIDKEWDTPPGRARSTGGDVLMRAAAFDMVGGFRDAMIAGEEPELCCRLRFEGWTIWRLDAEMTRHDANLTRFSQWWRRTRRSGHAYAEGFALHGRPPERHNARQLKSAILWGGLLPLAALIACLIFGWPGLLFALIWPVQILRQVRRGTPMHRAAFLMLGKIPELLGALSYVTSRWRNRRMTLIEYK